MWDFGRQRVNETGFFPRALTFHCQYLSTTDAAYFWQCRVSLNSALHYVLNLLFTMHSVSLTPLQVNSLVPEFSFKF
jgi:hypothetical protein